MKQRRRMLAVVAIVAFLASCAGPKKSRGTLGARGYTERGEASWYGKKFHGRTTANGERYDMYALTAAHKTLPFDVIVEVTNLSNGRSVEVRINDRGPFKKGRIIDLSYAAASELKMIGPGVVPVRVVVIGSAGPRGALSGVEHGRAVSRHDRHRRARR